MAEELPRENETGAQRVLRIVAKAPIHIILVIIGVLWLVPTLGLFFTSLLAPERFNESGWWQILSKPSLATLDNYDKVFNTDTIVSSLWTTVLVSLGGTIFPIFIAAMAAYAFAWLDFPGRDWLFIVVIAMLVVPIQMAL
ncbi:MAG: alpha-glucoside transport system permease protein, partial [Thermoleophilaceae bacterium]|nr:alpha-glucoside transport system permease protein [Thermoleophilaceae bacterium]